MPFRKPPAERILAGADRLFYAQGIRAIGVVLGIYDRIERMLADGSFHGCPYVNAVTEIGDPKHPAAAIAVQFKEQRRLWYRTLLERLGARNADAIATQLQILFEGALSLARVRGDPAVARSAKAAAATLIDAAVPKRRSAGR